jgi:hypothetical protein
MGIKKKTIRADKFKKGRSWEETGQLPGGGGFGPPTPPSEKKNTIVIVRRERHKQEVKKLWKKYRRSTLIQHQASIAITKMALLPNLVEYESSLQCRRVAKQETKYKGQLKCYRNSWTLTDWCTISSLFLHAGSAEIARCSSEEVERQTARTEVSASR